MEGIKFRQPIRDKKGNFIEWFYWGFIDKDFITPALQLNALDTRKESQQYTGLTDYNKKDNYKGDIINVFFFERKVKKIYNKYENKEIVSYSGAFGFWHKCNFITFSMLDWEMLQFEIIGNIIEES